jgi:serpin B
MRALAAAMAIAALAGCDHTPTAKPEPAKPEPAKPEPAKREPSAPAHVEMPTQGAALAKQANAFAFELWHRLPAGNLAMSPTSIATALAMTAGGAHGATEAQMRHVLHLEGDAATTMHDWGALAAALQDPARPVKLRIANRLFGERTVAFEKPYLDATAAAYGAPLEALDFVGNADAARAHINDWVANETADRIKDLLPPGTVNSATTIVVVNAIYFLADWLTPFKAEATSPADFWTTATAKKSVATMHAENSYQLAPLDGGAMLELPYQGELAMYVFLPDKRDGLAHLEQGLDAAHFDAALAAMSQGETIVALPKFKIDPPAPIELGPHLTALGMTDAFNAKLADLTGIAKPPNPDRRLSISAVFHKAFVKVDEKGTEAAAATAVIVTGAGAPPRTEPRKFTADHPFLFAIVDKPTHLILFLGRVVDPSR